MYRRTLDVKIRDEQDMDRSNCRDSVTRTCVSLRQGFSIADAKVTRPGFELIAKSQRHRVV